MKEDIMEENDVGRVRCNHCGREFDETEIKVDLKDDQEFCPYCKKKGGLMDI
jgi:NAD-dependent SIR2 family protein deacetylase